VIHLSEDDLILLYYAERAAPSGAKSHLEHCSQCRAAAESLANALSICNAWLVPARPPQFGLDAWNRLAPVLEAETGVGRGWRSARVWISAAGFAVLLLAVFLAGRLSRPVTNPVMAGLSDQARERILAIAVADHLDRVETLLTEISHDDSSRPDVFATDRERAEDLVQEGRLMRQSLGIHGETATTAFLDEVERFLIEASHVPDSAGANRIGDLRERIDSGSLLFKVRIVESNLRNEERKL
jgi:hypothetical protein